MRESPTAAASRSKAATCRIDGLLDALHHGIATVYQEISLVPALSVAENILARSLEALRYRQAADQPCQGQGLRARNPAAPQDRRGPGYRGVAPRASPQQLVEIAKAVSYDPRVLVLDEADPAPPQEQVDLLHEVAHAVRARHGVHLCDTGCTRSRRSRIT
ncbi:MAG: hypothetical protein R3D59_01830 [Paracoccaceae bacterium]